MLPKSPLICDNPMNDWPPKCPVLNRLAQVLQTQDPGFLLAVNLSKSGPSVFMKPSTLLSIMLNTVNTTTVNTVNHIPAFSTKKGTTWPFPLDC